MSKLKEFARGNCSICPISGGCCERWNKACTNKLNWLNRSTMSVPAMVILPGRCSTGRLSLGWTPGVSPCRRRRLEKPTRFWCRQKDRQLRLRLKNLAAQSAIRCSNTSPGFNLFSTKLPAFCDQVELFILPCPTSAFAPSCGG